MFNVDINRQSIEHLKAAADRRLFESATGFAMFEQRDILPYELEPLRKLLKLQKFCGHLDL